MDGINMLYTLDLYNVKCQWSFIEKYDEKINKQQKVSSELKLNQM